MTAIILCVEDEAEIRADIVEELQDAGYIVHEAANGEEALKVFERVRPDLILSDVNMPRLSGMEFLERLRARPDAASNTPFIFLTAYGEKADLVRGRRLGADDYLVKPIDYDVLLAVVESRLRNCARLRDAERSQADLLRAQLEQLIAAEANGRAAQDEAAACDLQRFVAANLTRAMAEGHLRLFLQPQISLPDRRLVGAEALLRWFDPERGFLSPADFIPALEAAGLIRPVTDWVLREACAHGARLEAAGHGLRIAVNVSGDELSPDLVDRVCRALTFAKLPPERLEIEITETAVINNLSQAAKVAQAIRDLGAKVAVDDFGTGHSTLAYLRTLPVDVLKIDQTFIRTMTEGSRDHQIVEGVLGLARLLGIHTVAEGVEEACQACILETLGCDLVQGYLFARPLDIEAFLTFATGWREPVEAAE